jgi:4-hydroxy-2-oxoglutarate aldolase
MIEMKLDGVFSPLTSPFAPDGGVALGCFRENIARYNQTGIKGYVINGSTSEAVLLQWKEVHSYWEAAREAAAPGKIMIAGTGAESTAETIEQTNHAASLGYDLALIRTPSFYKPAMSEEALASHYLRVADAARIPILIYSVPVFTHIALEPPLVAHIARHPNVIGMKDSSGNVESITSVVAAAPQGFQALVGSSGTLCESLKRGATGAVLALACAFPEICVAIYAASRAGDSARAQGLQKKLMPPAKMLGAQYGIAGLKYAMDRLGYFGGSPRLPLLPLNEPAQREIDAMLADIAAEPAEHN